MDCLWLPHHEGPMIQACGSEALLRGDDETVNQSLQQGEPRPGNIAATIGGFTTNH